MGGKRGRQGQGNIFIWGKLGGRGDGMGRGGRREGEGGYRGVQMRTVDGWRGEGAGIGMRG